MIKNERFRDNDQLKQATVMRSVASFSVQPSTSQKPRPIDIPQRSIDPYAIDMSSIKGRFSWEKIPSCDTYLPVIFRDMTKYFCVKMLHKILSEYPDDVIRRSFYYQYRKPINLYVATPNEVELLNRINVLHARWAYSRQPFTAETELVAVSDFLPFYEHLQSVLKTPSSVSATRPLPVELAKQSVPQAQKSLQRSPDFIMNTPNANRRHSSVTCPVRPQIVTEISHNNNHTCSAPRPNLPRSIVFHSSSAANYTVQPIEVARQALQQELLSAFSEQPVATTSTNVINSTNKHWTNSPSTSSSHSSISTTPILVNRLDSPVSTLLSSTHTNNRKSSVESLEKQSMLPRKQSVSIASTSKPVYPYSGWLQINKLYTPFIAADSSNHQLYRIPVSLLTFYDLLKLPSSDNHNNELKDSSTDIEQTLVTSQEIEIINELCLKQNIKPFAIDTKLISLATFYRYYSANTLFIKELPLNDPKSAICKDWLSIVQTYGGIYRLRNNTTLHEQTVPFIGNNLLKIFTLSPQCSSSASITTPTSSELEFIQLILFFCNMSISLRNVKLVDIETVKKEYTIDLILLYNDKFPCNVLNYQQQGNRSLNSQEQIHQSPTSVATNTFAESTPPPSPRSPPTNQTQPQTVSQIPPKSSVPSLIPSSSSSSSSPASNCFQKTITFRAHQLTAYICSGLESTAQRECVSVRDLCNMLYPNSSIIDKLEARMLRLLRAKNISRFRPQTQQALGFTRLVDIKDIDTHWNYIQQEMTSSTSNVSKENSNKNLFLPMANTATATATTTSATNPHKNVLIEKSIEVDKDGKRSLERDMEIDDVFSMVQVDKRVRLSSENQNEEQTVNKNNIVHLKNDDGRDIQTKEMDNGSNDSESSQKIVLKIPSKSVPIVESLPKRNNIKSKKRLIQQKLKSLPDKPVVSSHNTVNVPIKKKIRLVRKRPTPRLRTCERKLAGWVKKYNIEECVVQLNLCDAIYDTGRI